MKNRSSLFAREALIIPRQPGDKPSMLVHNLREYLPGRFSFTYQGEEYTMSYQYIRYITIQGKIAFSHYTNER